MRSVRLSCSCDNRADTGQTDRAGVAPQLASSCPSRAGNQVEEDYRPLAWAAQLQCASASRPDGRHPFGRLVWRRQAPRAVVVVVVVAAAVVGHGKRALG